MEAGARTKKGVEKDVPVLLRKFVAKAGERRVAVDGAPPLLRRAAKLFGHIKDVLAEAPAGSYLATEYTNVLRNSILPVREYCQRAGCAAPVKGPCPRCAAGRTNPLTGTARTPAFDGYIDHRRGRHEHRTLR